MVPADAGPAERAATQLGAQKSIPPPTSGFPQVEQNTEKHRKTRQESGGGDEFLAAARRPGPSFPTDVSQTELLLNKKKCCFRRKKRNIMKN